MAQGRNSIREWLFLLACAVVLVFAAMVDRTIARRDQASRAAPTVPKAVAPPVAPSAPKPEAAAVVPAVAAPSARETAAEAAAREASWGEAREATIRVQQRLRAEQQAREAAQQEAEKNERCVDGQRMKRIENGWVQAGSCETSR